MLRLVSIWFVFFNVITPFIFHSLLMQSHEKLNNECPQCRGEFVGTRNYVVEEMIKQLSILRKSVVKKKDPADEADAIEYDEVKLSEAMAKLITSIPKPSERKPDEDDDNASDTLSGLWANMNNLNGEHEQFSVKLSSAHCNRSLFPVWRTKGLIAGASGPAQPTGKFACRMANCVARLPICRLLNHLWSLHKENITSVSIIS